MGDKCIFLILLFVCVFADAMYEHMQLIATTEMHFTDLQNFAAIKQGSLCEIIATFGANQHILFTYIESNGNFDCTSC